MRSILMAAAVCLALGAGAAKQHSGIHDDFSDEKLPGRRAARGDWKFADHTLRCTMDEELYRKFKNHGPIVFYSMDYTSAVIRYQFKADAARTVIFTANGASGHVFRMKQDKAGISLMAFEPDDTGKAKGKAIAKEPLPLSDGTWVPVEVRFDDNKVTVNVGDSFTKTLEQASFDVPKTNFSIGFAYGSMSLKDVTAEPTLSTPDSQ